MLYLHLLKQKRAGGGAEFCQSSVTKLICRILIILTKTFSLYKAIICLLPCRLPSREEVTVDIITISSQARYLFPMKKTTTMYKLEPKAIG